MWKSLSNVSSKQRSCSSDVVTRRCAPVLRHHRVQHRHHEQREHGADRHARAQHQDVVIDRSGEVRSVVVVPARPISPYGAEAQGYGEAYDPAQQNYRVAARSAEVANLGPFNMEQLGLNDGPVEFRTAATQ